MTRTTLITVLLLVTCLPGLAGLLGLTGGPGVALATVTPYAVLGAVVGVLVAIVLRARRAAVAAAVVLVAHVAWLAPLVSSDPPPPGRPLIVATANLRLGLADPDAVVSMVGTHAVDILAVQELTPDAVRRLREAGLQEVLPHSVVQPAPRANGSGLWSRLPLRVLPSWGDALRQPGALVEVGGREVALWSLHPRPPMPSDTRGWLADHRALAREVAALEHGRPVVLLGDLNATREHAPYRRWVNGRFRDAAEVSGDGVLRTWSPSPRLPALVHLDHVLVDEHVGVRRTRVLPLPGSDHRTVLAELVVR